MLSLRTALLSHRPSALTRQTVRVAYLVHWKSSHKPQTTILGRAFSTAPKSLPNYLLYKDLIDYPARNEYMLLDMWLADLSARQEARKGCEKWKQMSDRELRTRLENHVRDKKMLKNIKMMDDKEMRSSLEKALEMWASTLPKSMMNEVGEEYDAETASLVYESNLTEAEIDKAIDEEGKKERKENKDQ